MTRGYRFQGLSLFFQKQLISQRGVWRGWNMSRCLVLPLSRQGVTTRTYSTDRKFKISEFKISQQKIVNIKKGQSKDEDGVNKSIERSVRNADESSKYDMYERKWMESLEEINEDVLHPDYKKTMSILSHGNPSPSSCTGSSSNFSCTETSSNFSSIEKDSTNRGVSIQKNRNTICNTEYQNQDGFQLPDEIVKEKYEDILQGVKEALMDNKPNYVCIELLNEAISLDPSNPIAYGERAKIYLDKGEVSYALRDLRTALKLKTSDPEVFFNQAVLLSRKNNLSDVYHKSLEAYTRCIEHIDEQLKPIGEHIDEQLKPIGEHSDINHKYFLLELKCRALNNRGHLYMERRDPEYFTHARNDLQECIAIGTDIKSFDISQAKYNLSKLYQEAIEGQTMSFTMNESDFMLQKAISYYKDILKEVPDQMQTIWNLAKCYLTMATSKISMSMSGEIQQNDQIALEIQQCSEESLKYINKYIDIVEKYSINEKDVLEKNVKKKMLYESYMLRAYIFFEMKGYFDSAISDIQKAIGYNYSSLDPYYWLGKIYAEKGDIEQAQLYLGQFIERNNDPKKIDALIVRSKIYEEKKEYELAIEDWKSYISLSYGFVPGIDQDQKILTNDQKLQKLKEEYKYIMGMFGKELSHEKGFNNENETDPQEQEQKVEKDILAEIKELESVIATRTPEKLEEEKREYLSKKYKLSQMKTETAKLHMKWLLYEEQMFINGELKHSDFQEKKKNILMNAMRYIHEALELNIDNFSAWQLQAELLRANNQFEQSIKVMGKMIHRFSSEKYVLPVHQLRIAFVKYNRGVLFFKLGDYDSAMQDFDSAQEITGIQSTPIKLSAPLNSIVHEQDEFDTTKFDPNILKDLIEKARISCLKSQRKYLSYFYHLICYNWKATIA